MTTQKKPQAGEWWQYNGVRIYIAGVKLNGWLICEYKDGRICELSGGERWQHLPDCTGWDWQPEVWPKWYVPKQIDQKSGYGKVVAYYRRDAKNSGITVHIDGSQFTWEDWDNGHMKLEVTKSEALARVKPTTPEFCSMCGVHSVIPGTAGCKECTEYALDQVKYPQESPAIDPGEGYELLPNGTVLQKGDQVYCEGMTGYSWVVTAHPGECVGSRAGLEAPYRRKITPVESSDDWVTQDRVPDRPEIDEWSWIYVDGHSSSWYQSKTGEGQCRMHGTTEEGCVFQVRCRRKDLPPLPSPKRVPVRLWFDAHSVIASDSQPTNYHQELFVDANGFYVEVQP